MKVELKKDPTGFYYKRVAINIFQEILSTKIMEKIWNPSSESKSKPSNEFSESYFEKIAQKEFETSIYNQMSCSRILLSYYEQIISDEKTMINNRFSSNSSIMPANNSSKNLVANQRNANFSPQVSYNGVKKERKPLSLNILDFGKFNFIQIWLLFIYMSKIVYYKILKRFFITKI